MGIPFSVFAGCASLEEHGQWVMYDSLGDHSKYFLAIMVLVHMKSAPHHVHEHETQAFTPNANLCGSAGTWPQWFIYGSGAKGWETSFAASFCLDYLRRNSTTRVPQDLTCNCLQ